MSHLPSVRMSARVSWRLASRLETRFGCNKLLLLLACPNNTCRHHYSTHLASNQVLSHRVDVVCPSLHRLASLLLEPKAALVSTQLASHKVAVVLQDPRESLLICMVFQANSQLVFLMLSRTTHSSLLLCSKPNRQLLSLAAEEVQELVVLFKASPRTWPAFPVLPNLACLGLVRLAGKEAQGPVVLKDPVLDNSPAASRLKIVHKVLRKVLLHCSRLSLRLSDRNNRSSFSERHFSPRSKLCNLN